MKFKKSPAGKGDVNRTINWKQYRVRYDAIFKPKIKNKLKIKPLTW